MIEYQSREFCKKKCYVQQSLLDSNEITNSGKEHIRKMNCGSNCMAYKFHDWLNKNGYMIVKPETNVEEINFYDGIEMSLSGDGPKMLINALIEIFETNGGDNFLTMEFNKGMEKYSVVIERTTGKESPAEKIGRMAKTIAKLYYACILKGASSDFEQEALDLALPIISEYGGLKELLKDN